MPFNAINNEPEFAKYLNPNGHLVHKPHFESAVRKILLGEEATLNYEETESVKALQASQGSLMATVPDNDVDDFATICLEKRKKTGKSSLYISPNFILPTSDMVERFFSNAGFAFSDFRQVLLPINLEMQLFLKVNHRFWDDHTVDTVKNSVNINAEQLTN